jgi:hypothetical protein
MLHDETQEGDSLGTIVKESALLGQLATFNSTLNTFDRFDSEDEAIFQELKRQRREFIKEYILKL